MGNTYLNEGRPTFTAAAKINEGQLCVLTADGKLTPHTTALASSNKNTALVFALTDAELGEIVACKLVGSAPGSVLAVAAAGTYAPGAPVYAADAGKVTATAGTRLVGVYLGKNATVEDGAAVEVAPVFAVLS
jgi:ribosomal protein L7Ae-like RNA K-turn-binding protein